MPAVALTHSCENEGQYEDQMRCEDDEEIDGSILNDCRDDTRSTHGRHADV